MRDFNVVGVPAVAGGIAAGLIEHCRLKAGLQRVPATILLLALLATSCDPVHPPNQESPPPEVMVDKSGIEMALVSAGTFRMGSDSGEDDESPAREVQIDSFWMDRYEVTQAQFKKYEPVGVSHFEGPDRPVEMIRWGDAMRYCNFRSEQEGLEPCYDESTGDCNFKANGYRLPTEAEWEYACRAGGKGDYGFGDDPGQLGDYAWFAGNSDKQTQRVGQKKPNAWGLYDMHGNVAEWCNDRYGKTYYRDGPASNPGGPDKGDLRVLRGGAWNSRPGGCRSAVRHGETPGNADACFARDAVGFRCVRRATTPQP